MLKFLSVLAAEVYLSNRTSIEASPHASIPTAHVTWLQEKAGDGSLAPVEDERMRSPAQYLDDPFYTRQIAIVAPATRVLHWLVESLGGEYEFGDGVD